MKKTFIAFLQQQGFTPVQATQISEQAEILELPSRHIIVQQGEIDEYIYFVVEGLCHACYLTASGKQFSKEFYWEKDCVIGYLGLIEQQASPYSLETLTPSLLLRLPITLLRQWRQERHPIYLTLLEAQLINKEKKERYLLLHSPKERYQLFCDRYPTLESRLTNYQIASYLGITPISLSRIKKHLEY